MSAVLVQVALILAYRRVTVTEYLNPLWESLKWHFSEGVFLVFCNEKSNLVTWKIYVLTITSFL